MKQYLEESLQISAEDAKFMEMAINLSVENIDTGGGPFGAVIVRDGEVIATGAVRFPFLHLLKCYLYIRYITKLMI